MKIHEYQAKEILQRFGVPIPAGRLATSADQAYEIAKSLKSTQTVVKAQIHAGGRGKGGGVKVCKTPEEVKQRAGEMLGMMLRTPQTGPEGQEVKKLLIEEGVAIEKELYVGLVLDRAARRVVLMLSSEGGMDIEEVARRSPGKIRRIEIDPVLGLMPHQVRELVFGVGLKVEAHGKAVKLCRALYEAYMATDATIVEINPLVLTREGDLLALDCKINFDDNALFRHPEIVELRDLGEEDPKEIEAKSFDLSYIALDGSVGCMVNGAGLAMATMDIIKHFGGEPANFLDVGGGANAEKVTAAFRIILQDPKVHAVFVNIFGGIMKCDVIAEGIIQAARDCKIEVPVVVRLAGTNVDLGKRMLTESGLPLASADDMADGARKVVKLAQERRKTSGVPSARIGKGTVG